MQALRQEAATQAAQAAQRLEDSAFHHAQALTTTRAECEATLKQLRSAHETQVCLYEDKLHTLVQAKERLE